MSRVSWLPLSSIHLEGCSTFWHRMYRIVSTDAAPARTASLQHNQNRHAVRTSRSAPPTPVDVVTQPQECAGGVGHTQRPQQALEVFEIAEIAVDVAEYVARLLQLQHGGFERAHLRSRSEHHLDVIEHAIEGARGDLPNALPPPVAVLQLLAARAVLVPVARSPSLVSSCTTITGNSCAHATRGLQPCLPTRKLQITRSSYLLWRRRRRLALVPYP